MRDKELYAQILGIRSPWRVEKVELLAREGEVKIYVSPDPDVMLPCPNCSTISPGYDTRQRHWRHLDTCQYKTILVADVPRIKCLELGIDETAFKKRHDYVTIISDPESGAVLLLGRVG